MSKVKNKICEIALDISVWLMVAVFVLVPLAVVIGVVKLMLYWLGVI